MEQNGDRSKSKVLFLLTKSNLKKKGIIDWRLDFYVLKMPVKFKRNRFSSFRVIFVTDLKKVI